ncbi:LON peptidase substrate-binding domain-containing protein [Raineyella sp. W15-4]|uniref:LON peptidase substrate-binding domain-containing protein n=1 Tax=Raineyella sp. W15-4 TaxID=3081651 RepID=UPI0029553269|nr:LON peptidase substrate-binding domain-containing protein [Raineyella sp. W15-4]WOQ16873.1 LON peptidase substrate-binding domain-containing protein [Raineyella sp. W15-4]
MRRLPLFPLGVVLFPGMPLQLQVFEPRYLRLLEDLSGRDPEEREFGIVAIREGSEVGTRRVHSVHSIGCAARLASARSLGERFVIRVIGTWRFRLDGVDAAAETPYATGLVTPLPEKHGDESQVAEHAREVRRALEAYATALNGEIPPLPEDPDELAYTVGALVPLSIPDQQELLAAPTTEDRLVVARDRLWREAGLIRATHSLPFRRNVGESSPN